MRPSVLIHFLILLDRNYNHPVLCSSLTPAIQMMAEECYPCNGRNSPTKEAWEQTFLLHARKDRSGASTKSCTNNITSTAESVNKNASSCERTTDTHDLT